MTRDNVEAEVAMMNSDQKLSWLCTRTFGISQDVSQLMLDVDYLKKNRHCPQHTANEKQIKELVRANRRALIIIAAIVLAMVGVGVLPLDVVVKILSMIGLAA